MRLSEVTRTDLQDLVDGLLASGLSESAIGVTLLPLRAIYKRTLARPETGIAVNPTSDLQMPAVTGGRDRIASPDECAELLAALRPEDPGAVGDRDVRGAAPRRADGAAP